jgi:hypothetical protein
MERPSGEKYRVAREEPRSLRRFGMSLQDEVIRLMTTDVMETPEAERVLRHDPEVTDLDDAAWQSFFSVQLNGLRAAVARLAAELDGRLAG